MARHLLLAAQDPLAPALPESKIRRERAADRRKRLREASEAESPAPKKPRTSTTSPLINPRRKTAGDRASALRRAHKLDDNIPLQRGLITGDNKLNKVRCGYCHLSITNKNYNLNIHFGSAGHKEKVENLRQQMEREVISLIPYLEPAAAPKPTGPGRQVDELSRGARENFVRYALIAGLPAYALEDMRPFFDAHLNFSIARMSDMFDENLTAVLAKEDAELRADLKRAKFACVVFDGTTHLGEASFFVVRYWKDGKIVVKCIACKHADKSMDGEVLCRLFKKICDDFGLKYSAHNGEGLLFLIALYASTNHDDLVALVAAIHDEAAVNGKALDAMKASGDLAETLDDLCASHCLSNAGDNFSEAKHLMAMDGLWNGLVSHSGGVQRAFYQALGAPCPRLTNAIRWYCKWEMWRDINHHYNGIADFLDTLDTVSDSVKKLRQYFRPLPNDRAQNALRRQFRAELIIVVTYGRPLCRLTYYFERSEDMVLCFAREKIASLMEFLRPGQDLPTPVLDVINTFEPPFNADVAFWKDVRDAVVKPVYDYLATKFSDVQPRPTGQKKKKKAIRRYRVWQLYKFAELLRPSYFVPWHDGLRQRQNAEGDLFRRELQHYSQWLPFLLPLVDGLHSELPSLRIRADRFKALPLRASNLFQDYWQVLLSEGSLPNWCEVVKRVALIPASTADVERAVSVFTDVLGDFQFSSMESTIEARVKVRFNNRKPKPRKPRRFYDDGAIASDEEEVVVDAGQL